MEWWEILIAIIVSIIALWMIGLSIAFFWVSNVARKEINNIRKDLR